MKLKILIILLLTCSFAFGQDYHAIITDAKSLYEAKEYNKSVLKYKDAFKINKKDAGNLYNAACCAALSGDKKLAFQWLNLALKNGWINISHIKTDKDLISLHESKQWKKLLVEMQKKADKYEANFDKSLKAKLIAIFNDDQIIRREFVAAQKEFGYKSKQVDSLGKIMTYKDSVNYVKVAEILDKYGWVGIDKVGGQANHTLFLVIQHSDLKTQQKYLPMMKKAVKSKNASANSLALLEDRVALGEGKRQIYGSQIGRDNETQKNYVLPLEDPENVDKRRAKVGLAPFAEYVKRWDIGWNVEEYKKLLPEIEAKQAKEIKQKE